MSLTIPEGATNNDFFWVAIGSSNAPGGYSTELVWRMLPHEVLIKWRWYFDYRAALYKVQNPRKYVEIKAGWESLEAIDPIAHKKLRLSRQITACKGKVTEWIRKVERAVEMMGQRSPLFPVENDPAYQAAMAKVGAKRQELAELQVQYQELMIQQIPAGE